MPRDKEDKIGRRLREVEQAVEALERTVAAHASSLNDSRTALSALENRLSGRLDGLVARITVLEQDADPAPVPEPEPVPEPVPPLVERDVDIETAVSSILGGKQSGIQIAIIGPRHRRYTDIGIMGPFIIDDQSEAKPGVADPKRTGWGPTVAAAYADYMAKGGKKAGPPFRLSDDDYAAAEFYCTPGNIKGHTSWRRTSKGWECDYFRSPSVHGKVPAGEKDPSYKTMGEAVWRLKAALGGDL